MATINNSDLSKELVDGAKIQIVHDKIPNQLAEKVVPVMEVNPNLLRKINILEINATTGSGTIYTTPLNKDFYLLGSSISASSEAAGQNGGFISAELKGKASIVINQICLDNTIAIDADSNSNSITYGAPILIERGSNITTSGLGTCTRKIAIIWGYFVEE